MPLQAGEPVVVVTSPHAPHKAISVNTLRAIFGMRLRTWPDGSRIHVFVLQDNAALHREFAKGILNVFPYQLRSAWDRMVFSGTGQAPVRVDSVAEMKNRVAQTPGAIGYLWRDNVDETVDVLEIR
ncbi:MAG: hypothetical protein D6698_14140 [Gammaproteobacteria bacterium]|nr:MAG: hypothetical protein D6698_14140 [Gammaproteobacteria bacterium]